MIYVITHKKFEFQNVQGYIPLQVGACYNEDLGYIKDDSGENISKKNRYYCELTGAYWVLNNCNDIYKGIVHYRRYFSNTFAMKPISEKKINAILKKYDVILPFENKLSVAVSDKYKECGFIKDIEATRQVIAEKYPDYVSSYDDLFSGKTSRPFNMIIAKENVFDAYHQWLFDILFEVEKRIDISEYSDYQKRVFGFLGERLINVYFMHNDYKIYECGVYPTETEWSITKRVLTGLKRKVFDIKQVYFQ